MLVYVAAVLRLGAFGRAPLHSWDTLSSMSFFHACNESGLWSERALDTITKFPFVTVEKGQAFNAPCPEGSTAPCAEPKIVSQLKAIKDRNSSITTVFYMNSVLSWYFYHMVRASLCQFILNQPSKCEEFNQVHTKGHARMCIIVAGHSNARAPPLATQ